MIPTGSPQDKQTEDLVNHLRDDVVPDELGDTGIRVEIGGVTAALEDQSEYMKDRMPLFIAGGRRALVPAPARRLPFAPDLAQGGDHEPAFRQRRLWRDDDRLEGRGRRGS